MSLSKESNDANLIKKIETAKKNKERSKYLFYPGFMLLTFGVSFVVAPFLEAVIVLYYNFSSIVMIIIGLLMLVLGVLLATVAVVLKTHYSNQEKNYYRKFTVIPKELRASYVCPNCKRDMPKEYADICIFCGYSQYNGKITHQRIQM